MVAIGNGCPDQKVFLTAVTRKEHCKGAQKRHIKRCAFVLRKTPQSVSQLDGERK